MKRLLIATSLMAFGLAFMQLALLPDWWLSSATLLMVGALALAASLATEEDDNA